MPKKSGQAVPRDDGALTDLTLNDFNYSPFTVKPRDILVKVDPTYFRPTEVDLLLGDPTKSNTQLGWTPEYDLAGLVEDIMTADIKLFRKDLQMAENSHEILKRAE